MKRRRSSIYSTASFSQKQLSAYHGDLRWAAATALTERCQFEQCNELVLQIQTDHGCFSQGQTKDRGLDVGWHCEASPPEPYDALWDADEPLDDPDEVVYGPDMDRILADNQHFAGEISLGLIEPYDSDFGTHLCIARDSGGYRASYIYNQELGWMLGAN